MSKIVKIISGILYAAHSILYGTATVKTAIYHWTALSPEMWLALSVPGGVFMGLIGILILFAGSSAAFSVVYFFRVIRGKTTQAGNIRMLIWLSLNVILFVVIPPQTYMIALYMTARPVLWILRIPSLFWMLSNILVAGTIVFDIFPSRKGERT